MRSYLSVVHVLLVVSAIVLAAVAVTGSASATAPPWLVECQATKTSVELGGGSYTCSGGPPPGAAAQSTTDLLKHIDEMALTLGLSNNAVNALTSGMTGAPPPTCSQLDHFINHNVPNASLPADDAQTLILWAQGIRDLLAAASAPSC